jgi:GTP-binding protein EngB required for normal cell division
MTTAPGPRTAALLADVEALTAAVTAASDQLTDDARERASAVLDAVRGRLALGVDHTTVALVGGTGSGKSSVFNALSGLQFADVGVRRPTTSRVAACVWAHDATALLDWLDVDTDRRIERESLLDADDQADLRGLVLLDLPDHDSVQPEHRAVVDRLLPMVDVVMWVVDPQKYADDSLHSGYLQHLAGHEAAMILLVNQIDTVPEHARTGLVADAEQLLRSDGLAEVRTLAASARTGEGMAELRAVLAPVVAGRGVAEVRAAAELDDVARLLARVAGGAEPEPPVARAVDALLEAAGVPAAVEAVRRGAPAAAEATLEQPTLGPVQADRALLVRDAWAEEVGSALPKAWHDATEAAVADDGFVRALDRALDQVPIPDPPRRPRAEPWTTGAAAVVALGAAAAAVLAPGAVTGAPAWLAAALGGLAALAALTAALVPVIGSARRRRTRAAAADALAAAGRAAVTQVVEDVLGGPTRDVLARHRTVREAVARRPLTAREPSSTARVPRASSTEPAGPSPGA